MEPIKIMKCLLYLYVIFLFTSCIESTKNKNVNAKDVSSEKLIENVKKAINPKYKNWVLFSHGTYIIIEDSTIVDKKKYALEQIKEFGPVFTGSPAGDFSITKLNLADGWCVSGHGYGMYTYVHPSELENNNPNDIEIGIYGRKKRDMDSKDEIIIYINGN